MNAFVVPPLDVEAFASKAMELLGDEGLYKEMSRNARQTIRNREKEYTFPYIREIWDKALV
jgi:glycosyltransferase involved in cell wall biosynthesis